MNAEEFLMEKLSEFNTMEMSNDKAIAVFRATVNAMNEFAILKCIDKCKEQRLLCADVYVRYHDVEFCRQDIINARTPDM